MALQFCDGCDSYGTIGDLVAKWGGYRLAATTDLAFLPTGGRFGGGAVRIATVNGQLVRKTAPALDELFLWAAVLPRSLPTSTTSFLWFEDVLGNAAALRMTPSGAVVGTQMGATLAWTATSAQVLVPGAWNTLAVHFRCADSGGRWRVVLNGVEQFDLTGDTRYLSSGPLIDRVVIGAARSGAGLEWDWDDVVLHDATGGNLDSLLTGDLKIETLRPIADRPGGGWSPSTGSDRFALVADAAPDPATFLAATTTGVREVFTLQDPAAPPEAVHALVVTLRGRRTDVGARGLRPLVRVGDAENLAPALPLANTLTTLQHPVYRNPDGDGPWTGASLQAAEIGLELGA